MRAYQCSRCELLRDYEEFCMCGADLEIRPKYRSKGGAKICKENFKPLDKKEIWHKKFWWESEVVE